MKAGVCSYCFNSMLLDNQTTLMEIVSFVGKETEADCFEPLTRFWDSKRDEFEQARELADLAREVGIEISCYAQDNNFHLYDESKKRTGIEESIRRLETALILGTNTVRLDPRTSLPGSPDDVNVDELIERMANSLAEVADAAAKMNIQIGLENHGRLLGRIGTTKRIIDQVNRPNFGINLDFTNFRHVFGEDHIEATRIFAQQTRHVHAKDFYKRPDDPGQDGWTQIPTGEYIKRATGGEGDMGWQEVFTLLDQAKYRGTISLEVSDPADIYGSVAKGVANIKRVIDQVSS
jgi:sugar phosphate isomerase/epimerase